MSKHLAVLECQAPSPPPRGIGEAPLPRRRTDQRHHRPARSAQYDRGRRARPTSARVGDRHCPPPRHHTDHRERLRLHGSSAPRRTALGGADLAQFASPLGITFVAVWKRLGMSSRSHTTVIYLAGADGPRGRPVRPASRTRRTTLTPSPWWARRRPAPPGLVADAVEVVYEIQAANEGKVSRPSSTTASPPTASSSTSSRLARGLSSLETCYVDDHPRIDHVGPAPTANACVHTSRIRTTPRSWHADDDAFLGVLRRHVRRRLAEDSPMVSHFGRATMDAAQVVALGPEGPAPRWPRTPSPLAGSSASTAEQRAARRKSPIEGLFEIEPPTNSMGAASSTTAPAGSKILPASRAGRHRRHAHRFLGPLTEERHLGVTGRGRSTARPSLTLGPSQHFGGL